MIESTSCEQSCDDCPSKQVEQLTLDLVQDRFQKEAKREELITKNYRLPYFVWGEGPHLVFIYGLCDSGDSIFWMYVVLSG